MADNKPASWYIPRASLSSNSSGSSSKDHRSNDHNITIDLDDSKSSGHTNPIFHRDKDDSAEAPRKFSSSSSSSELSYQSERVGRMKNSRKDRRSLRNEIEDVCPSKRFSRSSQGSTDSTNSSHSVSSLLLTAKNLENFAKINEMQTSKSATALSMANPPLTHPAAMKHPHNNLLLINKNLQLEKTKEMDELSEASSMHFTVVNGVTGPCVAKKSDSFCKKSRQVSILIVTMSILFLVMILVTVFLMELRARDMPR